MRKPHYSPYLYSPYYLSLKKPILGPQLYWSEKWGILYGGYTFLVRYALDLVPAVPSRNPKMLEYCGYTTDCIKIKLLKALFDVEKESNSFGMYIYAMYIHVYI